MAEFAFLPFHYYFDGLYLNILNFPSDTKGNCNEPTHALSCRRGQIAHLVKALSCKYQKGVEPNMDMGMYNHEELDFL